MIFYYVRHGDPIYDPDSLTELGHKQADALSKRFSLYGLDEIYSSTSIRAQQTAEPTCKLLNKEKTLLDWTHEARAWEDFYVKNPNGKNSWAFHSTKVMNQFNERSVKALGDKWYEHPYFEDTNFKHGVERINRETDAFMLSLGFEHNREKGCYKLVKPSDKRIALFAHEGFGKVFLSSLLDIPYPMICSHFELGHSGVTVIAFYEHEGEIYPKVFQWSNDSHLYKEEILTGYHNAIDV